jgi:hypothetical protein
MTGELANNKTSKEVVGKMVKDAHTVAPLKVVLSETSKDVEAGGMENKITGNGGLGYDGMKVKIDYRGVGKVCGDSVRKLWASMREKAGGICPQLVAQSLSPSLQRIQ